MDAYTAPLRRVDERMPPKVRETALRVLRERLDETQHPPDTEAALERAIAWLAETAPKPKRVVLVHAHTGEVVQW